MIEFEYGALPYKNVTAPSSEGVARVYTLVHTGRGPRQVRREKGMRLSCSACVSEDMGKLENAGLGVKVTTGG